MADDVKHIEVDIGAAMAALEASPELCEAMNRMIGGPALVEAQQTIKRITSAWLAHIQADNDCEPAIRGKPCHEKCACELEMQGMIEYAEIGR